MKHETKVLVCWSVPMQASGASPDEHVEDVGLWILSRLKIRFGDSVQGVGIGSEAELRSQLKRHQPQVVFNLCETLDGLTSREPDVVSIIEAMDIACTGSSAQALALSLDKLQTSQFLKMGGIRVPHAISIGMQAETVDFMFPVIIKPRLEDGSRGIDANSVVWDHKALHTQVDKITNLYHGPAMVEQYIEGRELVASVIGSPELSILDLGEIAFENLPSGAAAIRTYASKWHTNPDALKTHSVMPKSMDSSLVDQIGWMSSQVCAILGIRDYARIDFRVSANALPYVIDVNPNCDLSEDASFMRAVRRSGMSCDDAIMSIIDAALTRIPA